MSTWYSFLRGSLIDAGTDPEETSRPENHRIAYGAAERATSIETGWLEPPPPIAAQPSDLAILAPTERPKLAWEPVTSSRWSLPHT